MFYKFWLSGHYETLEIVEKDDTTEYRFVPSEAENNGVLGDYKVMWYCIHGPDGWHMNYLIWPLTRPDTLQMRFMITI